MFKFRFGLFWTTFVTAIFVVCLVIPAEQRHGVEMNGFIIALFILFEVIGLYLLISGLIQIIKDKKTKIHGIHCYGVVRAIRGTGAYVNGNPEYKAIVGFVNPNTNQMDFCEEIIGFKGDKYSVGSYVFCKYYKGDINIEKIVTEDEIPADLKEYIIPKKKESNNNNLGFSDDKEYVTIDGVKYKKTKE